MLDTSEYPNLEAWLSELETTNLPQTQGALAKRLDAGGVGYCCLGVGERMRTGLYPSGTLPPVEFWDWLEIRAGVRSQWRLAGIGYGNLWVDWPQELPWGVPTLDGSGRVEVDMVEESPITAASLNDNLGLSFVQIAQVIRHMGLVGLPELERVSV